MKTSMELGHQALTKQVKSSRAKTAGMKKNSNE
jgi:hypothetical protein